MRQKRVLAVEPDWRLRKLIRANLEAAGLEVWEAVSGDHGLMQLRECEPDVIVLDLHLPDLDDRQFLREARGLIRGRVPIVLTSADPPESEVIRLSGDAAHLEIPFSALGLVHKVLEVLGTADPEAVTPTRR